jgi:predicted phage gp36 major capsid-like protein
MFHRRRLIAMLALSAMVMSVRFANAALPPEVRRELSELTKELNEVKNHVRKKDVDQAKEIIRKVEDRIAAMGIDSDEKDRTYSTFKSQLEKPES